MSDRHRYGDDEVREIFALAAEAQDAAPPAAAARSGLTLRELQDVGREVDLDPERVAEAAALLDGRSETFPRRKFLGAPSRVTLATDLPRAPTDREWETVAGELRETFGARGRVISRGSAHEWTDGEVHAVLEPTTTGQRLRLDARTSPVNAGAVAGGFGLLAGLLGLVTSALDAATFGPVLELLLPALLMLVSAGAIGLNVLRLRRWAKDREDRLKHIADQARHLLEASPDPSADPSPDRGGEA